MTLFYVETMGDMGIRSGKWYATEQEAYAAQDALIALGYTDEATDEGEANVQVRWVDGPEELGELVNWLANNCLVIDDVS